jgi:Transposase, Mutator family
MIKETPEMTETVVEQESVEKPAVTPVPAASDEQLVAMLVDRARSEGLQLTGEGGLLQMLTKRVLVLESALEGEITDHLGYEKHDAEGRNSGNNRNGTRAKTVLTDVGPVEVKVPRDVAGTFEPQIVKKRQRRLLWGPVRCGRDISCRWRVKFGGHAARVRRSGNAFSAS